MKPAVPISKLIAQALQHHQAGELAEAAALYRRVLSQQPRNAEVLRLLGVLFRQQGQSDQAVEFIQRSIDLDPQRPEAHHNLGDALRSQGKLPQAAAAYIRAQQLRPDWAEAHGALGNVLHDQGKLDEAADSYRVAIALKPMLPIGHFNLGRVLHEQGKNAEAIESFTRAIQLKPNWPEAHNHLGNVLWDEQKLKEAVAAYSRAVALRPAYPAANWSLGKILLLQGQGVEALACFQRVIDQNPDLARAYTHMGFALSRLGRREEARQQYVKAIQLEPDDQQKRFKLAVLSGDNSASRVPAQYVRDLFNKYADTFDRHLVDCLDYRVPQLLRDAVASATTRRDWDVLDLGCGTGLCGQQFRPHARRLVGVDLAPGMIRAAANRRIYDQLFTDELLSVLRMEPDRYDVIVAGDVLIYVGDLAELMPAVARALRAGGVFAFSIEHHEGVGYFLHSEERFAHSPDYVLDQAARAGLREAAAQKVSIRKHAGADVPGWIIVLAK